jgi:hypothetical protein
MSTRCRFLSGSGSWEVSGGSRSRLCALTIAMDTLTDGAVTGCSSDTLTVVRFVPSSGVLTGITDR